MIQNKNLPILHWLRAITAAVMLTVSARAAVALDQPFLNLDGEPVAMADFFPENQWLVVMIWSHTCVICAREIKGHSEMHERHKDGRIAVLGISLDGEAGLSEAWGFLEERGVAFPNLVGEPHVVAEFFKDRTGRRLQGTPTFMVFAPGGTLTALQVGPVPPEAIEKFIRQQDDKA